MYTPSKFKQQDLQELRQFVAQNPFATLVAATSNGIDASHLPLIWVEEDGAEFGCLYGHFAKGNHFWKNALPEQSWLIIFQNAGHYISANYYPSKARDHKVVPTWNYQVVHMRGKFQLIDNFEEMKAILTKQTHHFEQHQPQPWQLSDAPESYIQSECRGIIGFKIVIEQIEGKYKLSQNQSDENKQSVVHCLRQENHFSATKMAELIEKYSKI